MFVSSLRKYKYREGINLVIYLITFAHMKRAKNITPRPLPSRQRYCGHSRAFSSCPCFQVHSIVIVYVVPTLWEGHCALCLVHSSQLCYAGSHNTAALL